MTQRQYSTNWSVGDTITAPRLQDFNKEFDRLFSTEPFRSKVTISQTGVPLQVDISELIYNLGEGPKEKAATVGYDVPDGKTVYLMLDEAGVLSHSEVLDEGKAIFARVTTAGGVITEIKDLKADAMRSGGKNVARTDRENTFEHKQEIKQEISILTKDPNSLWKTRMSFLDDSTGNLIQMGTRKDAGNAFMLEEQKNGVRQDPIVFREGKLGIGTKTPKQSLDVKGSAIAESLRTQDKDGVIRFATTTQGDKSVAFHFYNRDGVRAGNYLNFLTPTSGGKKEMQFNAPTKCFADFSMKGQGKLIGRNDKFGVYAEGTNNLHIGVRNDKTVIEMGDDRTVYFGEYVKRNNQVRITSTANTDDAKGKLAWLPARSYTQGVHAETFYLFFKGDSGTVYRFRRKRQNNGAGFFATELA